ncbi:MAG TPA: sigma-70 family RNA polymerase sigma factor [Blastocatellia bacterium]|nr:sigma-70 family RNA polymerase sigma factor [Blastocatellia bacterium]
MSVGDMAALEQTTLARLELEARPIENQYEASLLARLRTCDWAAFEELVSHFERPVYALCLRLLGDAEEARDAAQETFLKVYKGLASFRGDSGLKTWIYRIAINQAMNQQRWWRRRHRDETVSLDLSRGESEATLGHVLPDRCASPEQLAIAGERERRIMRALNEIKQEYRVALILREIEELSYEEIAETLTISIGTVKSRIARGREELRRRVKDLME